MKFGINFFPAFRESDSTTPAYYDQCLHLAERADVLGYNSVKTVEHSFFDYGGRSPNPCLMLSAVAARTKRIRVITGAVIPAFHHPVHLGAELAGVEDVLLVDRELAGVLSGVDDVGHDLDTPLLHRLRLAAELGEVAGFEVGLKENLR